MEWMRRLHPGLSALVEVGVLFLPAIPAYIWVWPNLDGAGEWIFQILSYGYVLAGTLFVGLRRWSLSELGVNWNGLWLSLICASAILAGRLLIIFSVDLGLSTPQYDLVSLAGEILFYVCVVAVVEELLYRGLIYRALDDWRGARWAIWGSSFGFLLWHIFGQGPVIGLTAFFIGLLFALIRWRAGGIVGLILLHGLWDLETALLVASSNQEVLDSLGAGRPEVLHPLMMFLGLALLLIVPVYLWLLHPRVLRLVK